MSFAASDQAAGSLSLPLVLRVVTVDLGAIGYNNHDNDTCTTLHSRIQLCDRDSSSSDRPVRQTGNDNCTGSTKAWPHVEFELLRSYP